MEMPNLMLNHQKKKVKVRKHQETVTNGTPRRRGTAKKRHAAGLLTNVEKGLGEHFNVITK